jgi:hypothetical protein
MYARNDARDGRKDAHMTAPKDDTRAAFLAASTPAQGARVLGVSGKWLRDILRGTLHVHVSRGGSYDEATRGALYDAATARIAKRTATDAPE